MNEQQKRANSILVKAIEQRLRDLKKQVKRSFVLGIMVGAAGGIGAMILVMLGFMVAK